MGYRGQCATGWQVLLTFSCFARNQSHKMHKYPHPFGNIFGGHFVSKEMVWLNMLGEFKDLDRLTHHARAHFILALPKKMKNDLVRMNLDIFLESDFALTLDFNRLVSKLRKWELGSGFEVSPGNYRACTLTANKCANSNGLLPNVFFSPTFRAAEGH